MTAPAQEQTVELRVLTIDGENIAIRDDGSPLLSTDEILAIHAERVLDGIPTAAIVTGEYVKAVEVRDNRLYLTVVDEDGAETTVWYAPDTYSPESYMATLEQPIQDVGCSQVICATHLWLDLFFVCLTGLLGYLIGRGK